MNGLFQVDDGSDLGFRITPAAGNSFVLIAGYVTGERVVIEWHCEVTGRRLKRSRGSYR